VEAHERAERSYKPGDPVYVLPCIMTGNVMRPGVVQPGEPLITSRRGYKEWYLVQVEGVGTHRIPNTTLEPRG
jgi:hypothetical protein